MQAVPVSVLIPTRNDAENLRSCLEGLRGWADEIVVVDSASSDGTLDVARANGASILTFAYHGGWPKKRQWALDTYSFRNAWILLLDADEIVDVEIRNEIARAIKREDVCGYQVRLRLHFLGRALKHGGFDFWKLSLFRRGRARFERRFAAEQTTQMGDIEIHEHVIVDGRVEALKAPILHQNHNSLYRFIQKHNEYSEWEARLYAEGQSGESAIRPALFGTQVQRRRWLKKTFVGVPGFPILTFIYHYVIRLGLLDGRPGLTYCGLKAVQRFHSKAKWYELELKQRSVAERPVATASTNPTGSQDDHLDTAPL